MELYAASPSASANANNGRRLSHHVWRVSAIAPRIWKWIDSAAPCAESRRISECFTCARGARGSQSKIYWNTLCWVDRRLTAEEKRKEEKLICLWVCVEIYHCCACLSLDRKFPLHHSHITTSAHPISFELFSFFLRLMPSGFVNLLFYSFFFTWANGAHVCQYKIDDKFIFKSKRAKMHKRRKLKKPKVEK